MEQSENLPVEHQNVPQAHESLHNFLYSADDEHSASNTKPLVESSGQEISAISEWAAQVSNAKVAGVYAVLDSDRQTQYIGYSRNILLSLNGHIAQLGHDICAYVRVQSFKFPKRTEMESLRDAWISELNNIPPGNAEQSGLWAGTVGEAAAAAMSAEERNAYEEKKLKLRRAMADSLLSKELDAQTDDAQTDTHAERQQKLEAAVKDDDWSAVIQGQTEDTRQL